MTQFQILEYEEICGIIVQIPKNAMDKIVTPLKNLYYFFTWTQEIRQNSYAMFCFSFYDPLGMYIE